MVSEAVETLMDSDSDTSCFDQHYEFDWTKTEPSLNVMYSTAVPHTQNYYFIIIIIIIIWYS